jgi:hypothetical protein
MSGPDAGKPNKRSSVSLRPPNRSLGAPGDRDMRWLDRLLRRRPEDQQLRELETELKQERQLRRLVNAEYQERVVRGVLTELRKPH